MKSDENSNLAKPTFTFPSGNRGAFSLNNLVKALRDSGLKDKAEELAKAKRPTDKLLLEAVHQWLTTLSQQ